MYVACELATGSKYWSAYQLWCVGANRCRRCLHLTQNMPKCECGQACSTDARCLASVKSTQPMITAALIFVFFYFWSDFFRIPGTLYSWIKYMSLEDWVAQRFNFNAPPAYLQMLKDHTLWITKQGALRKDQKPFQIFPKLIIHGFFVEGMALPIRACIFRLLGLVSSDWQYVTVSKINTLDYRRVQDQRECNIAIRSDHLFLMIKVIWNAQEMKGQVNAYS